MIEDIKNDIYGRRLHYRNDYRLRRSDVKIALTPEHVEEYKKCANDILYFIENYCHINDPNKGLSLIQLRQYQKDLLKSIYDNKFNILNLSRQSGKCVTWFTKITLKNKKGRIRNVSIGRYFIEQKIKYFFRKLLGI